MAKTNLSENLHTIFDGMACPRCNCNDATRVQTVDLGFGSFIRSCSVCNWSTGIDDSINLCQLDEENWEFQPNDAESGSCLENTKHYPIFMGFSELSVIGSRCKKCKKTGIMFYKGQDFNRGNREFQDTDSVFDTIFKNITEECDTTNEARLLSDVLLEFSENDELSKCNPPLDLNQGAEMVMECDRSDDNPELTQIKCGTAQKCSETHHRVFENTAYLHKARVCSWDMIGRGDHISRQRHLPYEHHAIVLSVDQPNKKMTVVEYGFNFAIINGKPKLAVVRESEETIEDLQKIFLYRYDYDPENSYAQETVIERALSRIEERLYNVFFRNCEHFATWCKTGKEYCSQIIPLARGCGLSAVAFILQLTRPLIRMIKDEVFQMIVSGAAVDDVVDFTVQQIARVNVDKTFKIGRIGFTVLLNAIVELCVFYHNYCEVKTDFEMGKITESEFQKRKLELIGESIGGLTLGLLLGFTWLFGLGIIGTLVLNILGTAGGRLCGSWIGRKLYSLKPIT